MRGLVLIAMLLCGVFSPTFAIAKAKLQLYPTRITLKDGKTSAEINVVNGGTAIGRYRATVQDMQMPEHGALKRLEEDEQLPHSAKPFVRLSPRSVTVPPGQSQKFRLLVRAPRDLPDGEYRTHLHVLMSSDDVESEKTAKPGETGFGVRMKPRFRVSIPIILMRGEASFTSQIDALTLQPPGEQGKTPAVLIDFTSEGTRSTMGDLVVTLDKNGEKHELFRINEFTIYRGTNKRRHRAPLKLPEGVTLDGGVLNVTYTHLKRNGGELITSKQLAM